MIERISLLKKDQLGFVRHLLIAFSLLIIILLTGITGYHIIEGWGFLDSFYMTVISITTVGFREVYPLSSPGKAFTIILILVSLSIVTYFFYAFATILIEGHLLGIYGRMRMEKKINKLNGHYIICGFGRVGEHLCAQIEDIVDFVVIEKEPERVKLAIDKGYFVVEGDATDEEVLINAGIKRAKGAVIAVFSDADSVYIILSARELNPNLYIVARVNDDKAERKLLAAGANKVISPYRIGGLRMANLLIRPNVVDFVELVFHRKSFSFQFTEILVENLDRLPSPVIRESGIRRDKGIFIVAIRKKTGETIYNPPANTTLEVGDLLMAMGEQKNLEELSELLKR